MTLTMCYNRLQLMVNGSQKKNGSLCCLNFKTRSSSAKYITLHFRKIRLGSSDKTIIDALPWMETGGKSQSKLLTDAYQQQPILFTAELVKKHGQK